MNGESAFRECGSSRRAGRREVRVGANFTPRADASSKDAKSAQSGSVLRERTQVNVAERAAPYLTTQAILVTHAEL